MILKEKLSIDASKKPNEVILFAEGNFYRAYEHSAWLFNNLVRPYAVKKRFVKVVDKDVVSLGFPRSTDLPIRPLNDSQTEVFVMDTNVNDADISSLIVFEEWKSLIPAIVPTAERQIEDYADIDPELEECQLKSLLINEDIADRIRSFPLESKSPMDCMLFLIDLKKLANGALY